MKISFFILGLALALLDVTNSAPLRIDYDFQTRSLDNIDDSAKLVIRGPIYELTANESSSTLVRRARRRKTKTEEEKRADATKVMRAGPVAGRATKEKEVADRQAEVDTKKTEVESKEKEKEQVNAQVNAGLTDRQKKQQAKRDRDEETARAQQEESKKKNPDQIYLTVRSVSNPDVKRFWDLFSKPKKGLDVGEEDGGGFVQLDDIRDAFRKCVPDDKFLFWSSGSDSANADSKQDYSKAISAYESQTGRMKIASAARSDECRLAGLSPMNRKPMIKEFHDWVEEEQKKDYLAKNPKNKAKKINFRWPAAVIRAADGQLNYRHYWEVMSEGYAAGAKGEVHYLRPPREAGEKGDYPGKHWVELELPALRKNKQVGDVVEFHIPYSANGNYGKKTQTVSHIKRLGDGAVEV